MSPTRTSVALTSPTTSPGQASSMVSRSWPNTEWAYLVANGLWVRAWVTTMPALEPPRAHPQVGDAVAVGLVHVRLDLEHEAPRRARRAARGLPVLVGPRGGRRGQVDHGVEQQPHAEVGEGRAEEGGRRSRRPGTARRRGRRRSPSSSADLVGGRSCQASPSSAAARSASTISSGASVAPRATRVKRMKSIAAPVDARRGSRRR